MCYDGVALAKERKHEHDKKEPVMVLDGVCCLSSDQVAMDNVHALSVDRFNYYFYFILYIFYLLGLYMNMDGYGYIMCARPHCVQTEK